MTLFGSDGVYAGIRYRVLPDASIEAMMPRGLVKFKNMDQLMSAANSDSAIASESRSIMSGDVPVNTDQRNANVPASAKPLDYYSILREAIQQAEQNSAQLRALVYERLRFNLKREALFGYSSMGLAELVRQVNDLELAIARIEASSVDDSPSPVYRKQAELLETTHSSSSKAVQFMPPRPIPPLHAGLHPIQWAKNFQHNRRPEEVVLYARGANQFIGIVFLGIVFIGTVIIAGTLWYSSKVSPQIEIANKFPKTDETVAKRSSPSEDNAALTDSSPTVPFPLPPSFGIYALTDNKLIELEALPINIPDLRVALSAEIKKSSITTISDNKPAFILFRRDLLNNAPQKITLRVVARMVRETKIVGGKVTVTKIEAAWRIRNISHELKVSPIPGQREMVIARPDDNVSLAPGRYALVLNRVGYDFTIDGPVQPLEFCLEGFETANGSVFTQCRIP
jgi:hypothetical protein